MRFLERLAARTRATDSIVCIGLDPEPDRIPRQLGLGAQAARRFLAEIVRATAEHAAGFKPNLAFFEQYGPEGLEVLEATLEEIPEDVPVILDAKRGDVPHTSAAYARALFGRYRADAATVAPYVGLDGIAPFCEQGFALVLARTSNPGAGDLQDLVVEGRPLYEHVVEACTARFPPDALGFVVGATYPAQARRLRALAPDRMFLIPGLGAQGGEAKAALEAALDARGGGVLPSSSRSVLYASSGSDFASAAEKAARELKESVNAVRAARAA